MLDKEKYLMFQKVKNQVMLIAYGDGMGRNLKDLEKVLKTYVGRAVGGLHILPFFPSSADRGFAPMTYQEVDPAFGSWDDVERLASDYYLMCDYMINHVSAHSKEYLDYLEKKDASPYRNFFIRFKDFWEGGEPTQEELAKIYKRKDGGPSVVAEFADGSSELVWSTFSSEQIDVDCTNPEVKAFNKKNLESLAEHGVALIRLDAFGYATKKAGTECFFLEPDVWELLEEARDALTPYGVRPLAEIHETYFTQLKLAARGYDVYDFALPLLVLQALYFGDSIYLKNWLRTCPRNQFTTLDTHDGIGVMDTYHLLPDAEIRRTLEELFTISPVSRDISTKSSHTYFDAYQVNCTYYSALGEDDGKYLTARAIQFFTPGIPMVYYVGMLAGPNDYKHLEETAHGRDINRGCYTLEEVDEAMKRPVVKRLLKMMELRNSHPAFNGEMEILESSPAALAVRWSNACGNAADMEREWAQLDADLKEGSFQITYTEKGEIRYF